MVLSAEAEKRYGSFTPRSLDTFRPQGDLPEEFYVDVPTATVHEGPIPEELRGDVKGTAADAARKAAKKSAKGEGTSKKDSPPPKRRRPSLSSLLRR
jgi:hypothetical protein